MDTINTTNTLSGLRAFAGCSDQDLALDQGALIISSVAYPNVDVDFWCREIDSLSELAAVRVAKERDAISGLCALLEFLYSLWGLKGNKEDFYDARNSYLNQVLERRKGIPISMATLILEVGRRTGLELQGVGFPAHFLVKLKGVDELFVDPFSGRLIDVDGCRTLLKKVSGGKIPFTASLLQPTSHLDLLTRTLTNLKGVYVQKGNLKKAIRVTEAMLLIKPDAYNEIRDRAILHLYRGAYSKAMKDLEFFLSLDPPGMDFLQIENLMAQARRGLSTLN